MIYFFFGFVMSYGKLAIIVFQVSCQQLCRDTGAQGQEPIISKLHSTHCVPSLLQGSTLTHNYTNWEDSIRAHLLKAHLLRAHLLKAHLLTVLPYDVLWKICGY